MDLFSAIIMGIVEGLSEFLPISSTGHLMLTADLLKLGNTEFVKSFEIAIQCGAILSVVVLYFRTLFIEIEVLKRVCVAFLPTAVIGFLFYKVIKHFLLGNVHIVLWSLILGGIFLVIFELLHGEKGDTQSELNQISYKHAFLIGIFQSLAIIPGVSRSAATIIGGLVLGMRRTAIVEFSFLLAVPTMLAATFLDLSQSAKAFSSNEIFLLTVGFFTSFIVALFAVKSFLFYIKTNTFIPFGLYRIIIAIFFWATLMH